VSAALAAPAVQTAGTITPALPSACGNKANLLQNSLPASAWPFGPALFALWDFILTDLCPIELED